MPDMQNNYRKLQDSDDHTSSCTDSKRSGNLEEEKDQQVWKIQGEVEPELDLSFNSIVFFF